MLSQWAAVSCWASSGTFISCRRKSRANQESARITVQHCLPIENNATDFVLRSQHRHVIHGIAIDDDEVGVLAFIQRSNAVVELQQTRTIALFP